MSQKPIPRSDNEKLKAAYALNLVSVSVSQIVEYNDSYILEQEYDAILNNLNLEQIPKDEALLKTLIELLNTLTFFRIQNLQREQIEKKYQHRMKNAIWSAIPNIGVVVTAGDPVAIAASLATQIGVGYMNYRKEKSQAALDREDTEMELRYTAIEQLNALKRELFTTAWRLADRYNFDDRYRLTEKQITQYNKVLMDPDDLRKYARLEVIQKNFAAYPPFWYFFGHTASCIANGYVGEDVRAKYRELAKQHFAHYEELNKFNILREDQLTSSFALEYIDLLMLENTWDPDRIRGLIRVAEEKSGDRCDILQLCAVAFLRIGDRGEAMRLLKILVNEDYNKTLNAQLLSGIYVGDRNRAEYSLLKEQVPSQYLYPMPPKDQMDIKELNQAFVSQQRRILKLKFKGALHETIDKYSSELYRKYSMFSVPQEYGDDFFANNPRASKQRRLAAIDTFASEEKRSTYLARIGCINLPLEYISIFEQMFSNIFEVGCFSDPVLQSEVINRTNAAIGRYSGRVNDIQAAVDSESFDLRQYERIQSLGVQCFIKSAFEGLFMSVSHQIDMADMSGLISIEGQLMNMCDKLGLPMPEIQIDGAELGQNDFSGPRELFDVSQFGTSAVLAKRDADRFNAMALFLREKMSKVRIEDGLCVLYCGDPEFKRYFSDGIFEKHPTLQHHSLMVLEDSGTEQFDLIFTTEGIVYVLKNKVRKKTPYSDCRVSKDALELIGRKYKNGAVSVSALLEIIQAFDRKFISIDGEKEYIGGNVTGAVLNEWFTGNPSAMKDGVVRVYAWPDAELLNDMGYFLDGDLDKEFYLLQFYYDTASGTILGLRIVEFDSLAPEFRKKLDSAGGVIKVER